MGKNRDESISLESTGLSNVMNGGGKGGGGGGGGGRRADSLFFT